MPKKTNDTSDLKEILEIYKQEIGKKKPIIDDLGNSHQELQQRIENENRLIKNSIKLKGYSVGDSESLSYENIHIKYHQSEINNNNTITKLLVWVVASGIIFLGVGIIGMIFGFLTDVTFTTISGIVLELVGVFIKALQTYSDNSKHKYFESLTKQKQREDAINLVMGMKEGKDKNKLIEMIVLDSLKSKEEKEE